MKTYLLLLTAFLPLMAGTQTPGKLPRHTFSEVQKSLLSGDNYKLQATPSLRNLLQPAADPVLPSKAINPGVRVEEKEKSLTARFPQHKTIKSVRESLHFTNDEAMLDSVLTFYFTSPSDSVLTEKLLHTYDDAAHCHSFCSWQMDTLTGHWQGNFREDYYPDQLGRDTLIVFYYTSATAGIWIPQTKHEFSYDSNNNQTKIGFYSWDPYLQSWRGEFKNESAYGELNQLIFYAEYSWDYYMNDWIGIISYEREFDQKGNMISDINSYWNYLKNDWIYQQKWEYEFDENGNQTMLSCYVWNETSNYWAGDFKEEYFYDSNGIMNLFIYYLWDDNLKQWQANAKHLYNVTINENRYQETVLEYYWNFEKSDWELQSEAVYESIENEGKILIITRVKDEETGEMIYQEKIEVVFDEQGNLLSEAWYLWSHVHNDWLLEQEYFVTYDEYNRNIETTYSVAKEIYTPTQLICPFDSIQEFQQVTGDFSCPDNDCLSVDTLDYIEGTGGLLWHYDARGLEYWGGFSQLEINNVPDLTDNDGIAVHFKILVPSNARLNIIFLESSGEEWRYENYEIPANTTNQWQQQRISFSELFIPYYRETINGVFDKDDVDKIQIQMYVNSGNFAAGSLLMDNLLGYNIEITNAKEIHYRNTVKYDAAGNVIADTIFEWNSYRQELVPVHFTKAEYNEKGRKTFYESYWWDDNASSWIGELKNESFYNDRNFLVNSVDYSWDYNKMEWFIDQKTIIEYNSTGLETLTEISTYDWSTNSLTKYSRHELTYDTFNNITSESWYLWNSYSNKWVGEYKLEWKYNPENDLVITSNYEWDFATSDWKLSFSIAVEKEEVIYNENGEIELLTTINWNDSYQQWMPTRKSYYFYNIVVGIDDFQLPLSSILFDFYPNPAYEVLNLKLEGTSVAVVNFIDYNGKTVKTSRINPGTTQIPIGDLSPGMYLVRIRSQFENHSKKLVIQD